MNTQEDIEVVAAPPKFFQLQLCCKNCKREMPHYFQFGQKIKIETAQKVCTTCGIDGGWEISER